jgi:uncharacterized NAD-dependent epimerase/dehydratase family protein
MKGNALILASNRLNHNSAKTTHGLLRKSDRFNIKGVIDSQFEGQDAGEVMDGIHRNIPCYKSISQAVDASKEKIKYLILGVATAGGIIPKEMQDEIIEGIKNGLSIVNGLHHKLNKQENIMYAAIDYKVELLDIRKSKQREKLNFWSGKIYEVESPIIAVLGTDCAVGKRTTARFIEAEFNKEGQKANMIYTGQTGFLQGDGYGFIFDSTLNDFVSGELEHAIYQCYVENKPDLILLEGQSALFNPSGPCGAEYLTSANAKAVILQHVPARKYFKGWEKYNAEIPSLIDHIKMINLYGSKVIAIAFNTTGLSKDEAEKIKAETERSLEIPVILPMEEGMDKLTNVVQNYIKDFKA